jgi:hypothetical protein
MYILVGDKIIKTCNYPLSRTKAWKRFNIWKASVMHSDADSVTDNICTVQTHISFMAMDDPVQSTQTPQKHSPHRYHPLRLYFLSSLPPP